jgi:hypothetical protein
VLEGPVVAAVVVVDGSPLGVPSRSQNQCARPPLCQHGQGLAGLLVQVEGRPVALFWELVLEVPQEAWSRS